MWQQIPAVSPFPEKSQSVGTVPILSKGAAMFLWHVGCLQAAPHAVQLWGLLAVSTQKESSLLYEIRMMRISFPWGKEKDGAVPLCDSERWQLSAGLDPYSWQLSAWLLLEICAGSAQQCMKMLCVWQWDGPQGRCSCCHAACKCPSCSTGCSCHCAVLE